jgi:hypothetical protein
VRQREEDDRETERREAVRCKGRKAMWCRVEKLRTRERERERERAREREREREWQWVRSSIWNKFLNICVLHNFVDITILTRSQQDLSGGVDQLLIKFSYKIFFKKPIVEATVPVGLNVAPPLAIVTYEFSKLTPLSSPF